MKQKPSRWLRVDMIEVQAWDWRFPLVTCLQPQPVLRPKLYKRTILCQRMKLDAGIIYATG